VNLLVKKIDQQESINFAWKSQHILRDRQDVNINGKHDSIYKEDLSCVSERLKDSNQFYKN